MISLNIKLTPNREDQIFYGKLRPLITTELWIEWDRDIEIVSRADAVVRTDFYWGAAYDDSWM